MARKPDEWMPLHIGDYHADTTHLTRDQHGAYLLLLMAYWRRGGPLPADDSRLAAIAKATAVEWRKLRPVMAEFFEEHDGQWGQKRADRELLKANAMTQAKADAGRKGAEKRWQTDNSANGIAMAEPSDCHKQTDAPIPLPEPEHSSLRSEKARAPLEGPIPGKALLPEWIPVEQWADYLEMRRRIRAPLTASGIKKTIGKLEKLRADGEDIAAVLDESIQNSWRGVFPVKQAGGVNGTGRSREKQTATDQHLSGISSLIGEIRSGRA